MATRPQPKLLAQAKPRMLGGATRGGCALANAYGKIDPLAVLPIHERLVRNELADVGAEHYRRAAKRLAGMRKFAPTPDSAAWVDALISDLPKSTSDAHGSSRTSPAPGSRDLRPPTPPAPMSAPQLRTASQVPSPGRRGTPLAGREASPWRG